MNYSVLNYLKKLKKLEKEFQVVEKQLLNKRRELFSLEYLIEHLEKEMSSLEETKITVNLGNLIREISYLSGIETEKINFKLELSNWFPVEIKKESVKEFIKQDDKLYYVVFSCNGYNDNGERMFNYRIFLPLDLFYESKDFELKTINIDNKQYIEVVINDNLNDINLNIDLGNLVKSDSFHWYPVSLFRNAVLNCLNNKKNKVRRKIK